MTAPAVPQGEFTGVMGSGSHRFTHFIAAGGEGQVFGLSSRDAFGDPMAGKIYGTALTREKAKKLQFMIRKATPDLRAVAAWPVDILASPRNELIGFTMPLVAGAVPLHLLLTPKTRLAVMPGLSYTHMVQIAENLARAVASLHEAGVVIGDINGQNFLVRNNGTVLVIDCDSMQVGNRADWASGVGVEDYIAPELQGKTLTGLVRSSHHDTFALAVLLFELLVIGRHPFGGHPQLMIGDAIRQHAHILSNNPPKPSIFDITGLGPADLLSPTLIKNFQVAFGSSSRPSANEWARALMEHRRMLAPCSANTNHAIPFGARFCPWCAMEAKKLPKLFAHSPNPATRTQTAATQAAASPVAPDRSFLETCLSVSFRIVWLLLRVALKVLLLPLPALRSLALKVLKTIADYVSEVIASVVEMMIDAVRQMIAAISSVIKVTIEVIWDLTWLLIVASLKVGVPLAILLVFIEVFGK